MNDFLQRLRERKLVQWALAYIAASFALIQVLDVVAQRFAWPDALERVLILALAVGIFVTLVLAWYHGEKGAQKVTGTELLILALLLAIGGGLLWRFAPSPQAAPAVAQAAAAPRRSLHGERCLSAVERAGKNQMADAAGRQRGRTECVATHRAGCDVRAGQCLATGVRSGAQ
ncbi:MAG: hypothetical protein KGI64_09025 [Xanthomonadaceae bacterium]|nr:hypothetical protein [Xanthomonadaceae bacterium]MDE1885465.1 hypothetical protein [Xanthomonadaceae bacterium]MDE2084988.1 hypothetical protein [Xanthomonadaceae bacterium]